MTIKFLKGETFKYMAQAYVKIQIGNIIKARDKVLCQKYHNFKLPTRGQYLAYYDCIAGGKQSK